MPHVNLARASRLTGISYWTLRHWEQLGVLEASRGNGTRRPHILLDHEELIVARVLARRFGRTRPRPATLQLAAEHIRKLIPDAMRRPRVEMPGPGGEPINISAIITDVLHALAKLEAERS